jgi:hypothetical protein
MLKKTRQMQNVAQEEAVAVEGMFRASWNSFSLIPAPTGRFTPYRG